MRMCRSFAALALMLTVGMTVPQQLLHAQTTAAGFIPGSFRVSETGAAVYEIPIKVSPGTAGMEPKLNLVYNSQGGNGLLGMGWGLSGLSAITRCPRTMAQDGVRGGINFDANDRFCLDGQRLVMVSAGAYGAVGAEYRTERETFAKVLSAGGSAGNPDSFEVKTKSGQTLQFGFTTDSRIEAQGKTSFRVWALNRIQDTKGNYIKIAYIEDEPNGDFRPDKIEYTGNTGVTPAQSVEFVYGDRPDIAPAYVGGSVVKTVKLITNIKTKVGITYVKDYRLTYELGGTTKRSRLATLKECNVAASVSCLAPIGLAWKALVNDVTDFSGPGSGYWTLLPGGISGDFNGDGKTDFIRASDMELSEWELCVSTGSGFTCSLVTAHDNWSANISGDFNGDGKTDLMGRMAVGGQWRLCLATGSGFTCSVVTIPTTILAANNITGDFNGDGKTDFVGYTGDDLMQWWLCLSNGSGFDCSSAPGAVGMFTGDFNGDGMTDLISYVDSVPWNQWNMCLSTGTGFTCNIVTAHSGPNVAGDFNGDGRTDIMGYSGSGGQWNMCLSAGSSFVCNSVTAHDGGATNNVAGDFNGDGMTDIMGYTGSGGLWHMCLSTGSGFNCSYVTSHSAGVANNRSGDFNGDGKTDLMGDTGNGSQWHVTLAGDKLADMLATVTTGLGAATDIVYKPLTDGAVYTKGAGAQSPVIELQIPVYVVSSAVAGNGIGGTLTTNYSYAGLRATFDGRGLLGFAQASATSVLAPSYSENLKTITTYRQDFPFTGLPCKVERHRTNASTGDSIALIGAADNTYALKTADGTGAFAEATLPGGWSACAASQSQWYAASQTAGATRHFFPYVSLGDEKANEIDGTFLTRVQTANQFDGYGNATSVVVTHLNSSGAATGYSKTTVNAFTNNATTWFLGRLTRSTVTSTTP